jgi:hypothetical protein
MARGWGWVAVGAGVACWLALAYVAAALHYGWPGVEAAQAAYAWRAGRRGPVVVGTLLLGGLLLIAWGLRTLGLSSDDPDGHA